METRSMATVMATIMVTIIPTAMEAAMAIVALFQTKETK